MKCDNLAKLRELKPKCLFIKGYREQADANKNPGKTQEVEAPGTRESTSKVGSSKHRTD